MEKKFVFDRNFKIAKVVDASLVFGEEDDYSRSMSDSSNQCVICE